MTATITGSLTGQTTVGHASALHSQLKLPDGRCVGDVDSGSLYAEFHRLQISGFRQTLGRVDAIDCYARHLEAIARQAGQVAVNNWLKERA
jgi:hypothetical protein